MWKFTAYRFGKTVHRNDKTASRALRILVSFVWLESSTTTTRRPARYERVKTKKTDIILNMLGILALTGVMAGGLIILYYNFFDSPKEVALNNRIKELQYYYDLKIKEIEQTNGAVEAVEYRDDNIYRIVLGAEL